MPGLTVHFEVLNQLNTPTLYADTLANRPAAQIVGRIFFRTDTPFGVYRDTGTGWDLVANLDTNSGGTVTSVAALTLGTSGTDLSSTVANGTTTPVITLNVPTASASNRGALSSTDWSTFNGKFTLPALTSGSVLFSDGTTIAQKNANFFWDNTNNRLGLGTATPGVTLDVHGTGGILHLNGTGTNNSFQLFQNAGTSKWRIGNNYSTGTNYFSIFDNTNSVETLKITPGATNTILFTGNLTATSLIKSGGTAAQILAADGSVITAGSNITISSGTISGSAGMAIGGSITSATAGSVLYAGASGVLAQTNSNFFWDSTNNRLGIGTATPTTPLDVTGNVNITGNTTSAGDITIVKAGASPRLLVQQATAAAGNRPEVTISAPVGFASFYKFTSATTAVKIIAGNDCALYNSNSVGDIAIMNDFATGKLKFATGGSATAQMTLTSAGRLLIGTTTEGTNILEVNGNTQITGTLTMADAQNIVFGSTTGTKLGSATTQKIGFWNVAPIVQPTTAVASATFVVNAGTAVNTLSTFDGYKIDQVVKALRNLGILA